MATLTSAAAVTIGPVSFTSEHAGSRVAALITNLLGDEKGRYYSESVEALMAKVRDVVGYPDTVAYIFNTDNSGEMTGAAHAQLTYGQVSGRYNWQSLV